MASTSPVGAQPRPGRIEFVRGGVVALADEIGAPAVPANGANGERGAVGAARKLPDGRTFWPIPWTAEAPFDGLSHVAGGTLKGRAPRQPTPLVVCRVPLEDVSAAALAGATPDAVVRFDPQGRRVAVGTLGGWLRLVDAWSGKILYERRIVEGMVKTLAFSPDGRRLLVGEQSPDAWLMAIDLPDAAAGSDSPNPYRVAWRVPFADTIESSRLATGERYSVYTLPAVFDLKRSADGRCFAVGLHSWPAAEGWKTRNTVACYGPDGALVWRFPAEGAESRVLRHLATDEAGTRVAIMTGPTPPSATNEFHPGGQLLILDGKTGQPLGETTIPPLSPHFDRVDGWDSIAMSGDGLRLAIGLADGRGLVFSVSNAGEVARLAELKLGSPLVIGAIPIAAPCSYTRRCGRGFCFQTQQSHIPFANAQTVQQPPSPHPGAETLTVTDTDGQPIWRYHGPFSPGGFWESRPSPLGQVGIVTCRERSGADRGQHGFLLFDLSRSGSGRERLLYYYPTEGPTTLGADISEDGQLTAVVEVPAPTPDGEDVYGVHQLHIVH